MVRRLNDGESTLKDILDMDYFMQNGLIPGVRGQDDEMVEFYGHCMACRAEVEQSDVLDSIFVSQLRQMEKELLEGWWD